MTTENSEVPVLARAEQREMVKLGVTALPALVQRAGPDCWRAFLNFFAASIENDNTRAAYLRAVVEFLDECDGSGIERLKDIEPFIVGAYVQHLQKVRGLSKPTVKLKLAALRKFFDYLVVAQVIPSSPAHAVRGPKVKIAKGKSPVLDREQLQQLLDAIDRSTIVGKRDYAWLTLAASSWCRVTALAKLTIGDYEHSGKRSFIHVEEKGGKVDRMPVHHKAQEALDEYIEAAGLEAKDSPIFQSVTRARELSGRPLDRTKVWQMVRRRARKAGLPENLCCHTFRGTGITLFLQAGGKLERAQAIAHHADSRTTKGYDHSDDDVTLEDIELVQF